MLGQDFFPLTGMLREPLLIIEWVIVFLFSELAFLLYMRVKNKEIKLSSFIEKASILFLLAYSIMEVFYIFGDYYMETQLSRLTVFNIGYLLRMILGLGFIYKIEKYQIIIGKYLFSKIFSIFTLLSVVIFFTAIEFTQYASLVLFWIPLVSIFFIYMIKLLKKTSDNQEIHNYKVKIYFSILGAILLGFGFVATSDPIVSLFGLILRLVGDIFQIIGILILGIFFINLPSLSEQNWKDKIDKLFLMRDSGICVYYKFFKDPTNTRQEQNISGAINTIKMILKEISNEDGEMVIEKEGKVLITYQGKYITGVIIADQNLNSLNFLLKRLIEKAEFLYSNIIRDWDGAMEIFLPIENIFQEIFS
ncbi:MAG: hypothetical protein KAX18_11580 [Candidatus Lokiarchaeota archaeon]|nr:hypothetical protein [Candidatus Lokiarchaeota archaeon]